VQKYIWKKFCTKCRSKFRSQFLAVSVSLRINVIVATVRFCNWFCEVMYNGEVNRLITYSADDIT
jgi:hypothetical protein